MEKVVENYGSLLRGEDLISAYASYWTEEYDSSSLISAIAAAQEYCSFYQQTGVDATAVSGAVPDNVKDVRLYLPVIFKAENVTRCQVSRTYNRNTELTYSINNGINFESPMPGRENDFIWVIDTNLKGLEFCSVVGRRCLSSTAAAPALISGFGCGVLDNGKLWVAANPAVADNLWYEDYYVINLYNARCTSDTVKSLLKLYTGAGHQRVDDLPDIGKWITLVRKMAKSGVTRGEVNAAMVLACDPCPPVFTESGTVIKIIEWGGKHLIVTDKEVVTSSEAPDVSAGDRVFAWQSATRSLLNWETPAEYVVKVTGQSQILISDYPVSWKYVSDAKGGTQIVINLPLTTRTPPTADEATFVRGLASDLDNKIKTLSARELQAYGVEVASGAVIASGTLNLKVYLSSLVTSASSKILKCSTYPVAGRTPAGFFKCMRRMASPRGYDKFVSVTVLSSSVSSFKLTSVSEQATICRQQLVDNDSLSFTFGTAAASLVDMTDIVYTQSIV